MSVTDWFSAYHLSPRLGRRGKRRLNDARPSSMQTEAGLFAAFGMEQRPKDDTQ